MAEQPIPSIDELARRTDRLQIQTQYDLSPEDYHELFYNSHECFMAHISKDGYPMVSPMWYAVLDDLIHLTTIKDLRYKTAALTNNPKMSLILTNFSVRADQVKEALNKAHITTQVIGRYLLPCTRIENIQAILIKAKAEISDDRELRAKVHRAVVERYYGDAPAAQKAEIVKAVDTPNRVIIKVRPIKIWHWDLGKMVGVR